VLSHHALFQRADPQSAPPLREGVWLTMPVDGCAVDVAKPAAQWPECADWTLIAQGRIVRIKFFRRHAPRLASVPFILAAGDPRVLQEPATVNPGAYQFTVVHPVQIDAEGKITAVETWSVVCPPTPASGEQEITIPGLKSGRTACYVRDIGTLNKVIRQGEAWAPHQSMRWIRDGDR